MLTVIAFLAGIAAGLFLVLLFVEVIIDRNTRPEPDEHATMHFKPQCPPCTGDCNQGRTCSAR